MQNTSTLPYPSRAAAGRLSVPPMVALVVAVVAPLAVVYASVYLSAAVTRPMSDHGGIPYNALRLAVSAGLCLAPLALWPFRTRAYALAAGLALTGLALLNLVHVFEYSELITIGAIDATVNTTAREAGEFFRGRESSLVLSILATALTLGTVVGAATLVPNTHRVSLGTRAAMLALGLAAVAVLAPAPMRLFPVSTVKNSVDYIGYRAEYAAAWEARAGYQFGAASAVAWVEPPVVVVVVGESTRRAQMGLYGYPRDTTPELGALDGVLSFTGAVAASSVTQPSVTMMMTSATPETLVAHREGSWLGLAREVGFETVWISNQDRTDGTAVALLSDVADRVVYTSHSWSASGQLDEDVLGVLDGVLAERDGPLAIVVHLMGSHGDYSLRYPERFAHWGAGSAPLPQHAGRTATEQRMIDEYDNTVAYTDWVTAQVFRRVEATGAPAAGVFVSDHGENLYDTPARFLGHGGPGTTPFEVEVPLLLWSTPAYRAARPGLFDAAAAHRARPASTAGLFYALADLVGADWPGARPERSLFSPTFSPPAPTVMLPSGEVTEAACLGEPGCGR